MQLFNLPARLGQSIWTWVSRGEVAILLFLGLAPLAITMALLWKTKQVIFDSVFGTRH